MQVSSKSKKQQATRDSAAKVLFQAAKTLHSPRLSALASRVRLDAFTKVKAAIDEMIEALLKEKKDEIKHKDFCTDGLNQNERETELKQRDIEDLEAEIADLTSAECEFAILCDARSESHPVLILTRAGLRGPEDSV